MSICAVVGCANQGRKSKADSDVNVIPYHRFPKDETLRTMWINYCCLIDQINVKMRGYFPLILTKAALFVTYNRVHQ